MGENLCVLGVGMVPFTMPGAGDSCNVMELHDCFTANELITYEALGICQASVGPKDEAPG